MQKTSGFRQKASGHRRAMHGAWVLSALATGVLVLALAVAALPALSLYLSVFIAVLGLSILAFVAVDRWWRIRPEATKTDADQLSFPESNPLPVVEVRESGVSFANPAAMNLFPDLKEKGLMHPFLDGLTRFFNSNEGETSELAGRDIECGGRWYHQEIYRAGETQKSIRVFAFDCSEAKLMEKKGRETQDLLGRIMATTPDAIFVKDTELRTIYCNEAFSRFVGKTPDEMYGKTDIENGWNPRQVLGDDGKGVRGWVKDDLEALAGNTVRVPQERVDSLSGVHYYDTVKMPLYDAGGSLVGLLGFGRDVTERRLAEEKLREQAELLNITTDAILVYDLRLRIRFWNKGAEAIYGWTKDEALGRLATELLCTEESASEQLDAHAAVMKDGKWAGTFHRKAKDGRNLILDVRWSLLRDRHDQPSGILSVETDVTERQNLQSQLLRIQRLESLGALVFRK